MKLLLSPHDDDSALFAAFTCMRQHPVIAVVTDSYIQPLRGEVGCDAQTRAQESARAHETLECETVRLSIPDNAVTLEALLESFKDLRRQYEPDIVYTPALEGGNVVHDLVTIAAEQVFGASFLRCYSTYAKHSQYVGADYQPVGTVEVEPTPAEARLKERVLHCFESQLALDSTRPHFDAVKGRSEWLSGFYRVHLGCGDRLKLGWTNIDRHPPAVTLANAAFQLCDVTHESIPMPNESVDYVFTEDFLEHLPPEHGVRVINEINRILVPGGIMEHYVPNAGSQNDFGSPSHLSHWNLQVFEHFNAESHRWRKDRGFEGIVGGFAVVKAELLSWKKELDGVRRAQSCHVIMRKVTV